MPIRNAQGLWNGSQDPVTDADVVITTAVVGYAYLRLKAGKNCAFAAEVTPPPADPEFLKLPTTIEKYEDFEAQCKDAYDKFHSARQAYAGNEYDNTKGWAIHTNAIPRLNAALLKAPVDQGPLQGMVVEDATPSYGEAGVLWIVGGTGDLSLLNHNRYMESPYRSYACMEMLDGIENQAKAQQKLYRGKGAYTGFSARETGTPQMFSSYRGCPANAFGSRWVPSPAPQIEIAGGQTESRIGNKSEQIATWGMIGSNKLAGKMAGDDGMVFRDLEQASPTFATDVVGYTHGMIQAIYDVEHAETLGQPDPGRPFEIGLKATTTKLASCMLCGLFMEANGFPASSIHLGAAESWAPSYADDDESLTATIGKCNTKWSGYCDNILKAGVACLQQATFATEAHAASFKNMITYLQGLGTTNISANLILDAATLHDKVSVRIVRTLPLRQP